MSYILYGMGGRIDQRIRRLVEQPLRRRTSPCERESDYCRNSASLPRLNAHLIYSSWYANLKELRIQHSGRRIVWSLRSTRAVAPFC